MNLLQHFRFRSITHRLVFACVIAAILIYSLSFWRMRQVAEELGEKWITYVAQSQVDTVAAKVSGVLRSIELNAQMIVQVGQQTNYFPKESAIAPLLTSVVQQSIVSAVAIRSPNSTDIEQFGRGSDRKGIDWVLGDRDITNLIAHCQSTSTVTQPFWTQPYPQNSLTGSLNDSLNKSLGESQNEYLSIAYCVPLLHRLDREPSVQGMLAIEITLDWLKKYASGNSPISIPIIDQVARIKMGKPFAIYLPASQWLVSPSASIQTASIQNLSWGSPAHTSILSQSTWDIAPVPKVFKDSQGILVFITLPATDWTFGIAFSDSELWQVHLKAILLIVASMTKDMGFMCVAIALVSRRTTHPLRALIASTEDIARGNLDTKLPIISQHDEVGRLGSSFRHMRDALKTYIQKLQETTVAKQKMESELSIAGQIQYSMLPKTEVADSPTRRYQLSTLLEQARLVGGDLYDFFPMGDDRLCIIIGDVADKGIPAALLMARTVTLMRTMVKQTSTPVKALSAVNRELCINNEECLFVTLFCGVLDLHTGTLHYASAGHDPPLLVRDGEVRFLDVETGPPLGIEDDAIFPECEYLLQHNDLIVLYTDGITEAMNLDGDLFSEARLLDAIASYPPSNPARAIRTIQHFHRQFVGDAPQSDDLTLLALQYQPSSPFPQIVEVVELIITINSELTELEKVKQRLGEILQTHGLAVESIEDAQLIVEEVLVNIIQYGYDNQSHQRIDLQVKISPTSLKMTFEDWGKPFNPLTEIADPDLSVMDDADRESGGLGFYLVRELADRVDYEHRDRKNILTIFLTVAK
ncbi:SpoIIE family protein phosphatase [Tumidithrix elongata RA019]|uniref:SpoIIE family protein phosphatase n=1 Tax=Tumidithrix elongata BACA0141 TaxID=2716417 RepID=A0AAW9PY58_9CYAN|nr:SpoIIE family protein phosphatase [Tumidithrix elongata RA019]